MIHRIDAIRTILLALAALVLPLFLAAPARAQITCGVTLNMNFGTINMVDSGFDNTAQSEVIVDCSGGQAGDVIRACVAIGTPRQLMRPAGGVISYNLSDVSAYGPAWGSSLGTQLPNFIISFNGSTASTSRLIYGGIAPGQSTAPTSLAQSSYIGSPQLTLAWDVAAGHSDCTTVVTNQVTASGVIDANYVPACLMTIDDLNFGTLMDTTSGAPGSATIAATCSAEVAYTIGLNNGSHGGTGPTTRNMQSAASRNLVYGLYRDAGFSQPWGNVIGSDRAAGTGTGTSAAWTVHGRIQPQATPPSGIYSDVVVVTIDY